MLRVDDLHSGYGTSRILRGVTLSAGSGLVTVVVGRNGVGKTTLLKTIMGLIDARRGRIDIDERSIAGRAPHEIARAGVAYVPEGRQIYPQLTVAENLQVGQRRPSRQWPSERLFTLFPNLAERLRNPGSSLSGGEQQMLAIARALVIDPTVMLLDEPSQGLAPKIVAELSKLIRQLAQEGMTILLVEQNLRLTEAVGDRILVMQKGQIVHDGSGEEFRANGEEIRRKWLTA